MTAGPTQAVWSDPQFAVANWGKRRGKPWTFDEHIQAFRLRWAGKSNAEIAGELGRSVWSVHQKIGYQKVRG